MKKLFVPALLALTMMSGSVMAAGMMQKHKDMSCNFCHEKGFTAPKEEKCLACHNKDVIVKATEHFNFEKRFKNPATGKVNKTFGPVNPHDNFHFGRDGSCFSCHKEHKESTLLCANCHDTAPWNMKAPR